MKVMKMSWYMERGQLMCRWFEAWEAEKYDVALTVVNWWIRSGRGSEAGGTLRQLVDSLEHV